MDCMRKKLSHEMDSCDKSVDRINFWVISLMHRYSSANFKKFMELGIHPGQLPVLKTVQENEGISLRELAKRLHVKPPTVTVTVKRMERAGLLCKKSDTEDLRISRIYLTEKGKSISAGVIAQMEENERILTRGFSEEELQTLRDFFERMIENLAQTGTAEKTDRRQKGLSR